MKKFLVLSILSLGLLSACNNSNSYGKKTLVKDLSSASTDGTVTAKGYKDFYQKLTQDQAMKITNAVTSCALNKADDVCNKSLNDVIK